MIQVLADHIDQLDLALDQLAMRDRNFDRFAMMLIDNVVELILHKHAQDTASRTKFLRTDPPEIDPLIITNALGRHFESKLKLAKLTGLIPSATADSILSLHSFRNTVYHSGVRHERILHSLAQFYFLNACTVHSSFKPLWWSSGSRDKIPLRAMKYIGGKKDISLLNDDLFDRVWRRLSDIVDAMGDTLISDLHADMKATIDSTDQSIQFLVDDSPGPPRTRDTAVLESQIWPIAFTKEVQDFAKSNGCSAATVGAYFDWLKDHYPVKIPTDPILGWRQRLLSLESEADKHLALKKYHDFIRQTQDVRDKIDDSAASLDSHIQNEIDIARGK